ncbi:PQQ-dependent sugar dehydrogenase [Saccharopolyspora indica]|uniref:PQQ-dependent sugar dehydrogenase n=1 Tax=Saccharopolyspora indica TaxID=1229659 RepID=UPI0022EAAA2C|nr:PQQ-dependent sugar dehydrogenase [Saccharopolyspora indica]MDA3647115.1 PQQ-dependent sugar dehydrogenase [Saccharopolyspora indica]
MLGLLAACGSSGGESPRAPAHGQSIAGLSVDVVVAGLENPWDIGFLPDGAALVSQRPGRLTLLADHAPAAIAQPVEADFSDVVAEGEGGLMGLLIHPDFASNRQFLTCQTHHVNGEPQDVRLVPWQLSEDRTTAQRSGGPLLAGIPLDVLSGHAGCRLALAEDGALLVTTGDARQALAAQDRSNLAGKVLRMDIDTGNPWPDNPFLDSPEPAERLVYTYGHRNPQGNAPRPGGQVLIAEHGPDADDEINLLRPGGNYGWNPVGDGETDYYEQTVAMTDQDRFPDSVPAAWSSGVPTEATCAATFLTGPQWGPLDGRLAVTALKGSKLMLFDLSPNAAVQGLSVPHELDGTHGRLRTARQGPDGALYLTTSNGSDDKICASPQGEQTVCGPCRPGLSRQLRKQPRPGRERSAPPRG